MWCPVLLLSSIHTTSSVLQSPANEPHFSLQKVGPFKASCMISLSPLTLLIMKCCWPDGGAVQNNGQLLLPFLKVPDPRNPRGLTTLIWCPCSTIKGHREQWKRSLESSSPVFCYCRPPLCVIPFTSWARTSLKLLFSPLLLQTESSSRTELFWRLANPAGGYFWLVSAH